MFGRLIDWVDIGSVPHQEECLPIEHEDSLAEVRLFVKQIIEAYPPPMGASVRTKAFDHDFGTYYEAVVYYDTDNKEAMRYAYMVQDDPENLLQIWSVEP